MIDFTDKKILITGASRGIGAATAILLDSLGAKLILHAPINKEFDLLKSKLQPSTQHEFITCDFKEPNTIIKSLQEQIHSDDKLSGFVNCVGLRARRPLKLIKPELANEIMAANFYSFFEVMKYATHKKRAAQPMSIVTISSIAAHAGSPGVGLYAASKAAVEASIKSWARELSSKQIRVNGVVCGQTNTEEYKKYFQDGSEDKVLERQYLGLNEPEDVANIVAFLLSEKSKIITGAMIPADGGYLS